jgi:uncharacterized membrane protein
MVTTPARRRHLLTLHLVSAVALLGVDLVLATLGVAGLGDANPETIYPAARRVGEWLAGPLAVAALVTGLGLLLASPLSLRSDRWVAAKLAITLLLATLLLTAVIPWLRDASEAALETGHVGDALRRRLAIAPAAASAALLINVLLGRYKPWRSNRTRTVRKPT